MDLLDIFPPSTANNDDTPDFDFGAFSGDTPTSNDDIFGSSQTTNRDGNNGLDGFFDAPTTANNTNNADLFNHDGDLGSFGDLDDPFSLDFLPTETSHNSNDMFNPSDRSPASTTNLDPSMTPTERAVAILESQNEAAKVPPLLEGQAYPEVEIVNRIAEVNLCCEIDLRKLTISLRNCEFNPLRSASMATIRWPTDGVVFRVARSGKVSILGLKDLDLAKKYAKKIAYLIRKLDHPKVRFRGFRSVMVMGHFDCQDPVRLEDLYDAHKDLCTFEPELSASLIFRFPNAGSQRKYTRKANETPTILVHVTGRCLVQGCPDQASLNEVVRSIYPILRQFRT